jgi:hypothetical protein
MLKIVRRNPVTVKTDAGPAQSFLARQAIMRARFAGYFFVAQ